MSTPAGGGPDRGRGPDPERGPGPGHDPHRLRPTAPGLLVGLGCVALVLGWGLRQGSLAFGWPEPDVPWVAVGLVFVIALCAAVAAYQTSRAQQAGVRLEPHRAVNRLVVGKAMALVGAVIAGGYAGFALAQLGTVSQLAGTRMLHAALAALGGLAVVAAALWLEHACRVPRDRD